jgi:hypothetical protein
VGAETTGLATDVGTVIEVSGWSRTPKIPRMAEAKGGRWMPWSWVVSTPNTMDA